MNISSMVSASTAARYLATSAVSATSSSDALTSTLRKPVDALSRQTESAKVQLSAFGQVKSAVADVQTAANGLQDSKALQTLEGAKKAAQAFVKAYNAENTTTANLLRREGASGTAGGALADDARLRQTAGSLQRAVGGVESELKQAGITRQKDGSLKVDEAALTAAFNKDASSLSKALSTVGSEVGAVATKQLSASGKVGGAIATLKTQVSSLEGQQKQLQGYFDQAQSAVREQANRFAASPFTAGVDAYRSIFSI